MNIVRRLTLRHLKENKKRSLTTIFGIIVSVAMITAVTTSATSLIGMIGGIATEAQGDWIGYYSNLDQKNIQIAKEYKNVKDVVICQDVGNLMAGDGLSGDGKNMLRVRAQQTDSFEHVPLKLSQGTNPSAPNEIALSRQFLLKNNLQWKVGNLVSLTGLSRTWQEGDMANQSVSQFVEYDAGNQLATMGQVQQYKLVGLIENSGTYSEYNAVVGLDKSAILPGSLVDIYTTQTKLSFSSGKQVTQLGKEMGAKFTDTHTDYLRYQGYMMGPEAKMVYGASAIIMAIIMIASFTLIYNAFSISVSERSRYLGMLASVGASKKQKRSSVYYEGAILGAVGIPLGILAGIGGIGITFLIISPMLNNIFNGEGELKLVVSGAGIGLSVLVSIVTIFLSAYLPGRRASNTTAIDAIRGTKEITIKAKNLKTSKLTRKLFGYEGELALKNMKRNKKKYRIIVASLAVSVVLFLSVNSFSAVMNKALVIASNDVEYDIEITSNNVQQMNKTDEFIKDLDGIQKKEQGMEVGVAVQGKPELFDQNLFDPLNVKGKAAITVQLFGVEDDAFRSYCKANGMDPEVYFNQAKLTVLVRNYATISMVDEEGKTTYAEYKPLNVEVGDTLEGATDYNRNDADTLQINEKTRFPLAVGGIVKDETYGNVNFVTLLLPKSVLESFALSNIQYVTPDYYTHLITTKNKEIATKLDQFVTDSFGADNSINIFNAAFAKESMRQMVTVIEIFTYGFIVLIGLICITNIFNTIATGVQLRRREFAMIKSVGMSPKSFYKMISFESIFYGIKALLIALPLSVATHFGIVTVMQNQFMLNKTDSFSFGMYGIAIAGVFVIVGLALIYSMGKVRHDNIIDALKNEDN